MPPRDRGRRRIGWLRGQPATEARAAARGVDRGRTQPGAQFFVDPLAGPANLTAPTAVFFAVCAAMTRAIPGQPATTTHPSKPTEDVRAVDLELAQRCRHGDAAAFEELYRAHAGRLYNLVFRMVGSAQEAEDLLQDVFLNAYRKLGSFRGDRALERGCIGWRSINASTSCAADSRKWHGLPTRSTMRGGGAGSGQPGGTHGRQPA